MTQVVLVASEQAIGDSDQGQIEAGESAAWDPVDLDAMHEQAERYAMGLEVSTVEQVEPGSEGSPDAYTDGWRESRVVGVRAADVDLDDHVILAHRQALYVAWVETSWRQEAACKTADPNDFFPTRADGPEVIERAKAICRLCSVAMDCAVYAFKAREKQGVFGEMSGDERRHVGRAIRAAGVKPEHITAEDVVRAVEKVGLGVTSQGRVREVKVALFSRATG